MYFTIYRLHTYRYMYLFIDFFFYLNKFTTSIIYVEKDSSTNRSIALPQDPRFWTDLFRDSKKWGLEMYEQDWLDVQYLLMK